jgi:twinkle protein
MKLTELTLRPDQTSGQIKTTCPLCRDQRTKKDDPSLSVNLTTGGWDCHHCGETGWLEDVKNPLPFANKAKKTYKVPDASVMEERRERLDADVLEYFQNRGISEKTLTDWKIGSGPSIVRKDEKGNVVYQDGVMVRDKAIWFPFYEDGKLVNVKHLRPKEWNNGTRIFRAFGGGKPVPFGLDNAGKRIFLVEGEIDALSVYEAGVDEVWSVPNGVEGLGFLEFEPVVEKLQAAEYVYIAVDADPAGQKLQEELIRRLKVMIGPEKLMLVYWIEDCKDANDVLVKHGPAMLYTNIVEMAQPLPMDGISEIYEFTDEFLTYYREGLPKGVSTGIPALDPLYRVMPGMVTVITGVTNYGKSELMDEIVRGMIEQSGWKFAFYSPENYPMSLHMIKLAEKYIGKPFDQEKMGHMSEAEAIQASEWMQENLFYINPRGVTFSVQEILERAKVLIYRKGIKGLVIDPWNYVKKEFGGLREDQFINDAMQQIGVFTKDTGIHIWLTVHPRTLRRDKEDRIQVPTVMELSGGSKFGDNADFMLAVHRDPKKAFETKIHEVDIHVQKSRYKYAATQGMQTLIWNPFNGRFDGDTGGLYVPDHNYERDEF